MEKRSIVTWSRAMIYAKKITWQYLSVAIEWVASTWNEKLFRIWSLNADFQCSDLLKMVQRKKIRSFKPLYLTPAKIRININKIKCTLPSFINNIIPLWMLVSKHVQVSQGVTFVITHLTFLLPWVKNYLFFKFMILIPVANCAGLSHAITIYVILDIWVYCFLHLFFCMF